MPKDRYIVLGMPGYGKQTAAAGRGLWRACKDMNHVWVNYQQGSLLACNFNQLWCLALNLAARGERVDYFAMLHDDIGPQDFWLDTLIDEMEEKQLDVLGAAVPIKDNRGLTSIALHNGDNWTFKARLTMREIFQLPETFTSDDVGYPLLLNTGCWVAKWNQEWCEKVHFEINDRIVFNTGVGRYQAQTEPEDWHFSRQLHEIGRGPTAHLRPLRIGATRKVAVTHTGEMEFHNEGVWGKKPFDDEVCDRSVLPHAFPSEIHGWLTPDEGKTLAEFAKGKRVLEIGSYCGLSTVCMARTAEHVTAVDYFDGRATPNPGDTRTRFDANIARYGLTEKVVAVHPDDPYPLPEYDRVFIDGAHDVDSVRFDYQRARNALAAGGLIAFHDYRAASHPGVAEVVNDIVSDGGQILSVTDNLAVVRPPAAIPLEV